MEVSKCWKIVQLPEISIKMKNCKIFYETQTASRLQEIIQPPTVIYRNIQTYAFKVFQECSSWASGNGAVQIFFLTPNRNMFAGKFVNSERCLAVLREYIIFNVKWVEFLKMSAIFWVKLYRKMNDFLLVFVGFESFC